MKVLEGQTLIDIAIQHCGSADAVYDISVLNGLSVTDELVPGTALILPNVVNAEIVIYYDNKGLCSATALVAQAELVLSVVDTFISIAPVAKKGVCIVLDNQDLLDVAVEYCGSADAAYDIALLNDLTVTDDLTPGIELKLPSVVNKKIASYYKTKGLEPATGITMNSENPLPVSLEGIGYWAIETDFIIS
jgi:hypothetical protein